MTALSRLIVVVLVTSLIQAAMLALVWQLQDCAIAASCVSERPTLIVLGLVQAPVVAMSYCLAPFLAGAFYPRWSLVLGAVVGAAPLAIWMLAHAIFPQEIPRWNGTDVPELLARAIVGVLAGTAGMLSAQTRSHQISTVPTIPTPNK